MAGWKKLYFGKHAGKAIEDPEVTADYLQWVLTEVKRLDPNYKEFIQRELKRRNQQ